MEVNLCKVFEGLLSSRKILKLKGTIVSQMVEKNNPNFQTLTSCYMSMHQFFF
jgi:hypothetical protein